MPQLNREKGEEVELETRGHGTQAMAWTDGRRREAFGADRAIVAQMSVSSPIMIEVGR
jgi:hypothetical protein